MDYTSITVYLYIPITKYKYVKNYFYVILTRKIIHENTIYMKTLERTLNSNDT